MNALFTHENTSIAVTCEDGSCTMWVWDRQKCVEDLVLPKGDTLLVCTCR